MSEGPPEHLGEECPNCGVVHRVIESLPDKPLSWTEVESLEDSERIAFAQGIEFMSGGMFGMDAQEVTENVVLSTSSSSMLLSRYLGTGWVVEQEAEHGDDESPKEVGQELWMEASQGFAGAMREAFEDG